VTLTDLERGIVPWATIVWRHLSSFESSSRSKPAAERADISGADQASAVVGAPSVPKSFRDGAKGGDVRRLPNLPNRRKTLRLFSKDSVQRSSDAPVAVLPSSYPLRPCAALAQELVSITA
jgi:hypothetical protein